MKNLANFIVKNRVVLMIVFLVALVASGVAMSFVQVNYDLTKYLPDSSTTKTSLKEMADEFGASGTASIMLENVDATDAILISVQLSSVEGISSAAVTRTDTDNRLALINVFLVKGDYTTDAEVAINGLKEKLDGMSGSYPDMKYYMTGASINAIESRSALAKEMPIIMLIAVAIVLVILLLTTRSFIEPLILLIVIGFAILINYGTNLIMGEISYISKSISAVLLIALAMDYSIVLMSRFREESEKEPDVCEAMKKTLAGSLTTIIASGCTVMAGLLALVFMEYKIGADIGIVLTKGVFISILAVIFLMPGLLILFSKLIKKTQHRPFIGSMQGVGGFAKATRFVIPFVFLAVVIGAFVIQGTCLKIDYHAKAGKAGSEIVLTQQKVEDAFGKQNPLVVMLDKILTVEEQQKIYDDLVAIKVDDGKGNKISPLNMAKSFVSAESAVVTGFKYGELLNTAELQQKMNDAGMDWLDEYDAQFIIDNTPFGVEQMDSTRRYTFKILYAIGNNQIISQYFSDTYGSTSAEYLSFITNTVILSGVEMIYDMMFNSDHYTRLMFNVNADIQSDVAKAYVSEVQKYLNDNNIKRSYVISNTMNVIETEEVFERDKLKVELISAIAILLIVLITCRKISIPVILVLCIEGALWINLSVNAFMGNAIFFICYLLGTAIQMGATIDYGILLTDRYVEARRYQNKFQAIRTAIDKSFTTIISSGLILVLAALTIGVISSVPLISSIGTLICMGSFFALLTMLFVLPQTFLLLDKVVVKKNQNYEYFVANNMEIPYEDKIVVEGQVVKEEQVVAGTEENVEEKSTKTSKTSAKKSTTKTTKKVDSSKKSTTKN